MLLQDGVMFLRYLGDIKRHHQAEKNLDLELLLRTTKDIFGVMLVCEHDNSNRKEQGWQLTCGLYTKIVDFYQILDEIHQRKVCLSVPVARGKGNSRMQQAIWMKFRTRCYPRNADMYQIHQRTIMTVCQHVNSYVHQQQLGKKKAAN
ncbi:hypothetical protein AVEN_107856-1 [Araneus ventricosus]|uniref:Uncharacterized protein n=1 Tax=Araneus ventricosus TaxID=182803 RepID=A0A4Y2IUX6_ARAVE|nr:hypothetical protein AVEN_107856-1 [Araneus ventricosus]